MSRKMKDRGIMKITIPYESKSELVEILDDVMEELLDVKRELKKEIAQGEIAKLKAKPELELDDEYDYDEDEYDYDDDEDEDEDLEAEDEDPDEGEDNKVEMDAAEAAEYLYRMLNEIFRPTRK